MKGLLILTKTLGDVMLGNILVENIKLKYPNIELDYVVESKYLPLVDENKAISKYYVVENTWKQWDEILKFSLDYDKLFLAQQTSIEDGSWHQSDKHKFANLLDFYAQRIDVPIKVRELKWYAADVAVPELAGSKKIFCHTTTLGDAKNWGKFDELCTRLIAKGFSVYQVGLDSDVPIVVEGVIDLRSKFNFKELATLFKQAFCFIGLDSGLSFIATSVGIPIICIMGASIPTTSGPFGKNVNSLLSTTRAECETKRCHALFNTCKYGTKCIGNLSVEEVEKAVEII